MSNFISSANDRKKKKIKLNNYTIQHNETIDRLSYIWLKPQITSISSVR